MKINQFNRMANHKSDEYFIQTSFKLKSIDDNQQIVMDIAFIPWTIYLSAY